MDNTTDSRLSMARLSLRKSKHADENQMAASMLGIEPDEVDSINEVKDLLAEITNIIGARPQFIKAAVVSRAIAESNKLVTSNSDG